MKTLKPILSDYIRKLEAQGNLTPIAKQHIKEIKEKLQNVNHVTP